MVTISDYWLLGNIAGHGYLLWLRVMRTRYIYIYTGYWLWFPDMLLIIAMVTVYDYSLWLTVIITGYGYAYLLCI